jgi:DNA-binding transcriptional MerR regulator
MSELTVGSLARLAGVTVRTLHHYDEIGLVVPAGRTESGYRTYGSAEVARLQEVLFFRELGFPLEKIREIVARPGYSRAAALRRQKTMLESRAGHLLQMIDAVDRAIAAETVGVKMTNEEMLEVFDGFDPSEYEEEARDRWGDTDAYQESARRTARYGKAEWEAIKAEGDEINQEFLKLMAAGTPADDPAAMDVAERHRLHITKWFYDCSKEIHAGLGQMYVADVRFKTNIDKAGEGLAEYMSAAVAANAARAD